jgi:hypothetical protein
MAFDSARGRVVLFGGDSMQSRLFHDTWEWDGENWTQTEDIGPGARSQHAMAYDDVRQAIVLFGGSPQSGVAADTWQWDGANWTQVADTGPAARSHHAMAFDRGRGRIVLFGGRLADGAPAGDTWEWDGEEWAQQEDVGPPAREAHAMAHDAGRDRVVLYGGLSGAVARGDTWEWDGSAWKQVAHFGANPRLGSGMVFKNERVELFGGLSSLDASEPPTLFRDTWEWDGKRWTLRQDLGPGPRWGHAMAFDSARSRVVLFGGLPVFAPEDPTVGNELLGDTWEHADPVVLRSLILAPSVASPGETVVATVTLTGRAAGTPAVPGQIVTLDSPGQRISDSFPMNIFIGEGSTETQASFVVNQQAAGGFLHNVRATMGASAIAALLNIRA